MSKIKVIGIYTTIGNSEDNINQRYCSIEPIFNSNEITFDLTNRVFKCNEAGNYKIVGFVSTNGGGSSNTNLDTMKNDVSVDSYQALSTESTSEGDKTYMSKYLIYDWNLVVGDTFGFKKSQTQGWYCVSFVVIYKEE